MYKVQDKDTFFTSPTLTQLYVKVDIYPHMDWLIFLCLMLLSAIFQLYPTRGKHLHWLHHFT